VVVGSSAGSQCGFDYQLICVLLDWWRPEMHMFLLYVGEMAVTL
jgi:hypothetical protein